MKNRGRRVGSLPSDSESPEAPAGTAPLLRQLAHILDALPEGVLVHDHQGVLVHSNAAAQAMLNLSVEQIAERAPLPPDFTVIQEDGTPAAPDAYPFRVALRTRSPLRDVVIGLKRADGLQWIAVNAVPFAIADDQPPGALSTFRDITPRKRAESREHEALVRLELAARSGDVGFWDWDLADRVVYSDEWKRQLGYEPHEIANDYREWDSRLHPDDRAHAITRVQRYLDGTAPDYVVEFRLRHKDGSYRWIYARGEMVRDHSGVPRRLLGCHVDVTDRKAAERAVLESRQRYANLVLSIDGIVWEADAHTFQFTYVSDQAKALLGYPVADWLSSPTFWADHIHPDDRDGAVRYCLTRVARLEAHEFEYRMVAADGRHIWIRDMVTVVVEQGQATLLRGLMLDVTDRHLAQAALVKQKEELVLAMEMASLGRWEFDPATRHIILDEALLRLLGTTAEAQGGTSMPLDEYVRRFLTDDAREAMADAMNDAMAAEGAEQTRQVEHRWRRADGSIATVTVRFVLVKTPDGQLAKGYGVIQDITERKKIETRLRHLVEGESVLAQVSQRFIEMDLPEFDDEVSNALATMSGFLGAVRSAVFLYSADGARVLNPYEWCADPLDSLKEEVKGLKTGDLGYFHREVKAFRTVLVRTIADLPEASAERAWAERHGFRPMMLLPLSSGTRLIGVLTFYGAFHSEWKFDDSLLPIVSSFAVSLSNALARKAADEERMHLERQLFQSQKIEAIGTLAGGIAHDFNNILTSIVGNLELARMEMGNTAGLDESLAAISIAADRATALVKQILAFSRHHQHERRVVSLPAIAAEAVRFMRATIPAAIVIELTVGEDIPPVLADPTQMHQILINLCANAWHAMESSAGRIEISVDRVVLDEREALHIGGIDPGDAVRVTVRDTGCGMDATTLKRVFEPFFTTKPVGKGTGLGMSVVHGIVQTHRGGIAIESEVGRGTSVHVYIKAARATVMEAVPERTPTSGAGAKVLFVDDESELSRVMSLALDRLGYRITSLSDARQAVELFRAHPDDFDVVVADYDMPNITGLELARALIAIRPRVAIVLWSGRFSPDVTKAAAQLGVRRLVTKPCDPSQLSRVLREVLDEGEPPTAAPRLA